MRTDEDETPGQGAEPSVDGSATRTPWVLTAIVVGLALALAGVVGLAALFVSDLSESAGPSPLEEPFALPGSRGTDGVARQPAQVSDVGDPLDADSVIGEYVALGDSYSAGPGLAEQRQDAAACKRSTSNYPSFLAESLDVTTFRDATCTGARTTAVMARQERPDGSVVPPQIDSLSLSTDLVTIGMSGNDADLFSAVVTTCPRLASLEPTGRPCRDALVSDPASTVTDAAEVARVRMTTVVREIRMRAPEAQVVVVGYPAIFPRSGTCDALPFAEGDVGWAATQVSNLNASLRRVAEDEGIRYVDLEAAGRGHELCSAEPWMAGVVSEQGADPWHPLPAGMLGAARAIHAQLVGNGR